MIRWCYTVKTHGFTPNRLAAEEITETLSGLCVQYVCVSDEVIPYTPLSQHRRNQLAGVRCCSEVAGLGSKEGGEGG